MAQVDPADLKAVDRDAEREMTDLLNGMAVPQQRTAAPMLVIYSAADPVVEQAWVESAIGRGCAMGDIIESNLRLGNGEDDMDATTILPWLRARFDNKAPVNLCPAAPTRP
jgi:hypothetical protein